MNSYWVDSTSRPKFNKLNNKIKADVCIIGAGITGIMTAYMLKDSKLNIVLIDKGEICSGITKNTTAKITSQHGLIYKYLEDTYGLEFAKKYFDSNENAINIIEEIVKKEKINCEFEKTNNYIYTCTNEYINRIQDEFDTLNKLNANVKKIETVELPFKIKLGIELQNQAKFHPLKYLYGITEILKKNNIEIYTNSKVENIKKEKDIYLIKTQEGSIRAKNIVMATHYPIKNFPGMYFLKMYQDMSYAIVIKVNEDFSKGMYISAESPTTSFRSINNELLIIGGQNHKTGDSSKNVENVYNYLKKYAKEIYPNMEVQYRWATEDCVSIDKVPYIGEFSKLMPNVFVATGYKKWGMTTSHVAAKIISDKILGVENKYEDIYTSTRLNALKNSKEFGKMLKQTVYSLGINKIKIPKYKLEDIANESGGVVEYNGTKVGVYKTKNGDIYAVKPFCKHLGCELTWNNLEKTWDCPCHGSRYDYKGDLITEPSVYNLDQIKL